MLVFLLLCLQGFGQLSVPPSTTWKDVLQNKKGSISVLWNEIEPFIYRSDAGTMIGVEYELMEGFKGFLRQKHDIELRINWVNSGSFETILPMVEKSADKGLFGMSFYSITEERKKKVKFSPAYMPDLNILVSNNNLPVYETNEQLVNDLPSLKAFTMKQTSMEDDISTLRKTYYPALPVFNYSDDYEILKRISVEKNTFGYVPVTMYVTALQRGVKIKRQQVMPVRRAGFAAIYPKSSDWDEPINDYFNSAECKILVAGLVRRYLGPEVANVILNVSTSDSLGGASTDIELLTKEREIVTQRLITTALEAQQSKTQRNIILIIGTGVLIIAGFALSRYRTKNRLNKILQARNTLIADQKEKLDQLNRQLNMKILQSKLNPHFLFNSLNAIQYHVGENDKKGALQYLTHFAGFLRNVLRSGDDLLIPVKDEAMLAEKYLWLEQHRFPDKFSYVVEVSAEAEAMQTPPMLVHSILQEALYMNVLNAGNKPYTMHISFSAVNDELLVQVKDNGPERTEDSRKTNGLQDDNSDILTQRIAVINRSAIKPVVLNYSRNHDENIAALNISQPLFNL